MVTLALALAVTHLSAAPHPRAFGPATQLIAAANAAFPCERAPAAGVPVDAVPPRGALCRAGGHSRRLGSWQRPLTLSAASLVPPPARHVVKPPPRAAVARRPPKVDPNSPRDPPLPS